MKSIRWIGAIAVFLLSAIIAGGVRRHDSPARPPFPRAVRVPIREVGSFDAHGPTIMLPGRPDAGSLRIQLETINDRPVPVASPRREGNRTVYDRDIAREIYIDRGEGLEQTFEFDAPVSEISVSGRFETLWEPVRHKGRGVIFRDSSGEVMAYGEAKAVDAAGHSAPVHLSLDERRWTLDVPPDFLAEARFPVVVDPLIVPISKSEALEKAESFDLDAGLVAILRAAVVAQTEADDFELVWPMPSGSVKMRGLLARQFSRDARILVHGLERDEVVPTPDDLVFVASAGEGKGRIQVAAQIKREGVQAYLHVGDKAYAQEMDFETMTGLFVIQTPVPAPADARCGTSSGFGTSVHGLRSFPSSPVPGASELAPVEAKIAIVADYQVHNSMQTRGAELDLLQSIFRRTYSLFRNELGIFLRIGWMTLYETPDPYGANLSTFQQTFDGVEGSGAERAAAVLVTGRGRIDGESQSVLGVARAIGAAGDRAWSYTIVKHIRDEGFASQVWAHELGHLFGSPHTDEYVPPFHDGTIMEANAGNTTQVAFGTRVIDRIRSTLATNFADQCASQRRLEGLTAFFTRTLTPGVWRFNCGESASGEAFGCSLDVPQGATFLRIQAEAGQGAYALAACRHLSAVPSAYEYQAAVMEDRQEVHVVNPAPGTWFVALYGTGPRNGSPRFSGVSLKATLNDPPRLANAQGALVRTLKQGMNLFYRIDANDAGRNLYVSAKGVVATGFILRLDDDLNRLAAIPLPRPMIGSSYTPGSDAWLPGSPHGGAWYARLGAVVDVGQLYLEALYTPTMSSVTQTMATLSAPRNSLSRTFRIVRPPGARNRLVITVAGGRHQGFDVLVTVNDPWLDEFYPDWGRNPFRSGRVPAGGALTFAIENPPANEYYVQLVGTSGWQSRNYPPYSDVWIRATWP